MRQVVLCSLDVLVDVFDQLIVGLNAVGDLLAEGQLALLCLNIVDLLLLKLSLLVFSFFGTFFVILFSQEFCCLEAVLLIAGVFQVLCKRIHDLFIVIIVGVDEPHSDGRRSRCEE